MNFFQSLLIFGLCIRHALASGQFVPESEYYVDDLGFLDVAIERGENARLCDQLLRVAFLANIILVGFALIAWGVYGSTITVMLTKYSRPVSASSPGGRNSDRFN